MPRVGLELLGGDLCCLPQPLSYPLDKEYETEVLLKKRFYWHSLFIQVNLFTNLAIVLNKKNHPRLTQCSLVEKFKKE